MKIEESVNQSIIIFVGEVIIEKLITERSTANRHTNFKLEDKSCDETATKFKFIGVGKSDWICI